METGNNTSSIQSLGYKGWALSNYEQENQCDLPRPSRPTYVADFIQDAANTLDIEIVGIDSVGVDGHTHKSYFNNPTKIILDSDNFEILSENKEVRRHNHQIILTIDMRQHLPPSPAVVHLRHTTTTFIIADHFDSLLMTKNLGNAIANLYIKYLVSASYYASDPVNSAFLNASGDELRLDHLLRHIPHSVAIDHIAILRNLESGQIEIMAQCGTNPSLNEHYLTNPKAMNCASELRANISKYPIQYISSIHLDPLLKLSDTKPDGIGSCVYINTTIYTNDSIKRQHLNGIWIRGACHSRHFSWEDLYILYRIGQSISVIASVGAVLATRVIQLQRITHANSSNISAIQTDVTSSLADLADAIKFLEHSSASSIFEAMSLMLEARDNLNSIEFHTRQMKAKITLSSWIEYAAGMSQPPNVEIFNLEKPIYNILPFASTLVDADTIYDRLAGVKLRIQPRKILSSIFVKSRADIIEFALLNLLENAVKYRSSMCPNISCDVNYARNSSTSSEYKDQHVQMIISDDGIGIDQHDIPFIFKSGWRSSRHANTDITGHGLGLYQVRALLSLIGSTISLINNKNPTSFLITIPKG